MTGVVPDGRDDFSTRYGDLVLHAENSVHTVRKRTVRWALLVVAAVVTAVVMTWLLRTMAPGGVPPWWIYPPLLAAWFVLLWSVPELLGLILAWRQVGWSVDVYEQGVVESRFGAVRQAMPFAGGVPKAPTGPMPSRVECSSQELLGLVRMSGVHLLLPTAAGQLAACRLRELVTEFEVPGRERALPRRFSRAAVRTRCRVDRHRQIRAGRRASSTTSAG